MEELPRKYETIPEEACAAEKEKWRKARGKVPR
jgi:hypothetical protein